jgi:hypothetical protein
VFEGAICVHFLAPPESIAAQASRVAGNRKRQCQINRMMEKIGM